MTKKIQKSQSIEIIVKVQQTVLKGQLQRIRIHSMVWLGGRENKVPNKVV